MAYEMTHKGEFQEKHYKNTSGGVFLKIGSFSYTGKIFIHTDSRLSSIVRIGKFCSIADSVNFFPNADHDTKKLQHTHSLVVL